MLPWCHQIIALSHYKLYYELTHSSRENLDNTHFFDLKCLLYKKMFFFRSWVMDFFFVLVHVFVIRLIACIYFTDDDHAWFAYTSLLLRHRHWSRNRRDCRPFIMESGTARGAIAWLRWNTWQVNVFNDHGDLYVMLVDYMICTQWNRINLITSTQSSSKLVSAAWTEVHILR